MTPKETPSPGRSSIRRLADSAVRYDSRPAFRTAVPPRYCGAIGGNGLICRVVHWRIIPLDVGRDDSVTNLRVRGPMNESSASSSRSQLGRFVAGKLLKARSVISTSIPATVIPIRSLRVLRGPRLLSSPRCEVEPTTRRIAEPYSESLVVAVGLVPTPSGAVASCTSCRTSSPTFSTDAPSVAPM